MISVVSDQAGHLVHRGLRSLDKGSLTGVGTRQQDGPDVGHSRRPAHRGYGWRTAQTPAVVLLSVSTVSTAPFSHLLICTARTTGLAFAKNDDCRVELRRLGYVCVAGRRG